VALHVEAADVAIRVSNIRTRTLAGQAAVHVICVISAIAAIEVALLVVALEVTVTVANITRRTGTSPRRTAYVVRVINAVAIVKVACLVVAPEVAFTVPI
jgi:hypothetical protein